MNDEQLGLIDVEFTRYQRTPITDSITYRD